MHNFKLKKEYTAFAVNSVATATSTMLLNLVTERTEHPWVPPLQPENYIAGVTAHLAFSFFSELPYSPRRFLLSAFTSFYTLLFATAVSKETKLDPNSALMIAAIFTTFFLSLLSLYHRADDSSFIQEKTNERQSRSGMSVDG